MILLCAVVFQAEKNKEKVKANKKVNLIVCQFPFYTLQLDFLLFYILFFLFHPDGHVMPC